MARAQIDKQVHNSAVCVIAFGQGRLTQVVSCFLIPYNIDLNDQIILVNFVQKTRHSKAGGTNTYRLSVISH
jgi:hypothetical protein